MPPESQRLLFDKQPLEDGATLAKSGVRDGDTVHLTARLAQDLEPEPEPEPDPVSEGVPPAVRLAKAQVARV